MQPSLQKNHVYRVIHKVVILITPFITTTFISWVHGADGIDIPKVYHLLLYILMAIAFCFLVSAVGRRKNFIFIGKGYQKTVS